VNALIFWHLKKYIYNNEENERERFTLNSIMQSSFMAATCSKQAYLKVSKNKNKNSNQFLYCVNRKPYLN